MNSQREKFEKAMNQCGRPRLMRSCFYSEDMDAYVEKSDPECIDEDVDRLYSLFCEGWQAATEQGVVPVRGDSVSLDVSTDEATAGNRVFGTLTGERNGGPERTWLAELDHFNYPAEQGVCGPEFYGCYFEGPPPSGFCDWHHWAAVVPRTGVTIHAGPPKPIDGGVPAGWRIEDVGDGYYQIWMPNKRGGCVVGTKDSRIPAVVLAELATALLATQQPPEQETPE